MTEHPGDLLSALLDGELSVAEADQVEAHVRECAGCARELEETRQARAMVRGLGDVDPPSWLETVANPHRRRISRPLQALVSVAASAGVLLLASSGVGPSAFSPRPADAVDRHAATVTALGVSRGTAMAADTTPTTAKTRDPRSFDAPLRTPPPALGGYRFVAAFEAGDGVHALYRAGSYGLSIFAAPGRVDWGALPEGQGTRMDIVGRAGWRWDAEPSLGRVVVYEDGGMVVTVVADEPGDTALAIAELLPEPRDLSTRQRLGRALTEAIKVLAPG